MNPLMITSTATVVVFMLATAVSSAYALAKPGGDFTAGNPAVAADVNSQFNTLYTALSSGTNSINIDSWTNTAGSLGYTGGSLGVGIAAPTAKFNVVGGSAVTLASATGFGVFGATTGSHIAIDSTQIQAKANATTASNLMLNPLGGNLGIGVASVTSGAKLEVGGNVYLNGTYGIVDTSITAEPTLTLTGVVLKASAAKPSMLAKLGTATSGSAFYIADSATTALVTVQGDGKVGIGNSSPGSTLDVTGSANVGSLLSITGSTAITANFPGTTDRGILSFATAASAANQTNFAAWTAAAANSTQDFFLGKVSATAGGAGTVRVRIRADGYANFIGPGGNCDIGDDTTPSCTSDERLKINIVPMTHVLGKILGIRGVYFQWRDNMQGKRHLGVLAQQVEIAFPEVVKTDQYNGLKKVEYSALIPALIEAIRELKSENDTQVVALQKRAAEAEQKYSALAKQAQQAEARAAKLERLIAEESQARKQQEIRLARLEQALQRQVVARK